MSRNACPSPSDLTIRKKPGENEDEIEYNLFRGKEWAGRLVLSRWDEKKRVKIHYLRAHPKGCGYGTFLLKRALSDVDELHYEVEVIAVSEERKGLKSNVEWYGHFGFYPVWEMYDKDKKGIVRIKPDRIDYSEPWGYATLYRKGKMIDLYSDNRFVTMYRDAR